LLEIEKQTNTKLIKTRLYLPINVADIFNPRGGISHTAVLRLSGIHSAKYELFFSLTFNICSSTSRIDIRPRKTTAAVNYK
jgi:hypothetical protein